MSEIKYKKALILILLFSILALVAAYFIEYVLGHKACNLCLIGRIPFAIAIIIISLCLFFKRFEKIFLTILSLAFFLGMLISLYHFGIEQGFIGESLFCELSTTESDNLSKETILNQLKENTISCKDVTFKILGLSLATINIFISLILSVILFKLFLNYEKNK
jgi:disulfide bond formation protein DsbB